MKLPITAKSVLELTEGDITDLHSEAIVNAANEQLQLGGGVAGAINKRGGPQIQAECNNIGPVQTGQAAITSGGDLYAKYVIHAVGPRYGEGNEEEKLTSAVVNSLRLADENHIRSIAFPAISSGIFGYPVDRCAEVMIANTLHYLQEEQTGIERIIFCLLGAEDYFVFSRELRFITDAL